MSLGNYLEKVDPNLKNPDKPGPDRLFKYHFSSLLFELNCLPLNLQTRNAIDRVSDAYDACVTALAEAGLINE